jgi:hypothetical protein
MISVREVQAGDIHALILDTALGQHGGPHNTAFGTAFSARHQGCKLCQVSMSFISIGGSQQAGPMVQISLHFPWKIWKMI